MSLAQGIATAVAIADTRNAAQAFRIAIDNARRCLEKATQKANWAHAAWVTAGRKNQHSTKIHAAYQKYHAAMTEVGSAQAAYDRVKEGR